MERVLRHPESLGGAGGGGTTNKPLITPQKPAVFQPGSLTPPAAPTQPRPAGIPAPSPNVPISSPPRPPPPVAPDAAGESAPTEATNKIRAFDQKLAGGARHEDNWNRSPNVTGTGAIHVKSFHAKLTGESLEFLDRQINEWLDAHPQYEVKFVSTTVGDWTGKLKEPNLIVQVWV
jgi:hypothetical protein